MYIDEIIFVQILMYSILEKQVMKIKNLELDITIAVTVVRKSTSWVVNRRLYLSWVNYKT